MAAEQNWHTLDVEDILRTLGSRHGGLSELEAQSRLSQFGWNELEEKEKPSPEDKIVWESEKQRPKKKRSKKKKRAKKKSPDP